MSIDMYPLVIKYGLLEIHPFSSMDLETCVQIIYIYNYIYMHVYNYIYI